MRALLGWTSRRTQVPKEKDSPRSRARRKLSGTRPSAGERPSSPGHQGLVGAVALSGGGKGAVEQQLGPDGSCPSRARAMRPMRTAPAVWELEGPTMTGPRMSNRFIGVFLRCDLM